MVASVSTAAASAAKAGRSRYQAATVSASSPAHTATNAIVPYEPMNFRLIPFGRNSVGAVNENTCDAICSRVRWSIRNCWEIGSESPGTSARADRIADHTANARPAASAVRAPTPSALVDPCPFADHQARSARTPTRGLRLQAGSCRDTSLISRNRHTTTRPAMFVILTNITTTAASGISHQANRFGHAHNASSANPAPVASTMASTLTIEDNSCTEYPAASVAPAPNAAHRPAPSRRASSQVRQAPSASQNAPVSRITVTGSNGLTQPPTVMASLVMS